MSATLLDALRTRYPEAVPGIDYFTDSDGASISAWYLDVPQPDATEIAAGKAQADLVQAKTTQTGALTAACQAAITAGFESDALGARHRYPNGMTDQANLQASVMASLLPNLPADWTTPFACIPVAEADAPVWPFKAHSAAQIQQVGEAAKAWVLAQRIQLRSLAGQVAQAADVAAIEAIVWTDANPTGEP